MIAIYSTSITCRLKYIAYTLFGTDISFYANKELLEESSFPLINYSHEKISANEIWIQPTDLLFQHDIQVQSINCFEWNGLKAFFKTSGGIPFDIFAASFYLITRYEEYLPHETDAYGRYAHTNSLAFKQNFLHLPLINLWMKELKKLIRHKLSSFTIYHSPFTFLPTYDIDIAYSYLHKSLFNNLGGFCNELFTGKWKLLAERVNVLSGNKNDPFDTYEWLHNLHEQYHLKPIYFFLLAERKKEYDKNISPHIQAIKNVIAQHAEKYDTGIHPSWQSGDNEIILKREIELLAEITQSKVLRNRQHYIRMTIPQTYRLLINFGITEEYSMGYGSINGFRASYCLPFKWFDLEKNEETHLTIHPFCYMEANSFFEQHFTAAQAAEELKHYHDIVKSVNGEFITIFHNHFLTKQPEWIEWRKMYEDFLKEIAIDINLVRAS